MVSEAEGEIFIESLHEERSKTARDAANPVDGVVSVQDREGGGRDDLIKSRAGRKHGGGYLLEDLKDELIREARKLRAERRGESRDDDLRLGG